jgi:hypothetical protein
MLTLLTIGSEASHKQDKFLNEMLKTWTGLNYHLPDLSFEEVSRAIYLEHSDQARPKMLRRLVGRANRIRLIEDIQVLGLPEDASED